MVLCLFSFFFTMELIKPAFVHVKTESGHGTMAKELTDGRLTSL